MKQIAITMRLTTSAAARLGSKSQLLTHTVVNNGGELENGGVMDG